MKKMWGFEPKSNNLSSECELTDTYLIYHIDKDLGIISGEVPHHLSLISVGKDCRDQRDAFICGDRLADQPFPGWIFTVHNEAVKLTNT